MSTTFYRLLPHELLLDNPTRRYVLRVRDLPQEDKPREKLLSHGPEALSSAELLAIVLSTGTRKEEVMAMATRISKDYGEKGFAHQNDARKLADETDIPLLKAVQLVACAELGRRFFAKNESAAPILRTPAEVFEHVKDMRHLPKEHLRGLYLNAHYKLIHEEVVSIGTLDANLVHPREVFKPAIEYSAAGVILVHNHPSGDTAPSHADLEVTHQLIQAGKILGIDLIDHLIVTKDAFFSIPVINN